MARRFACVGNVSVLHDKEKKKGFLPVILLISRSINQTRKEKVTCQDPGEFFDPVTWYLDLGGAARVTLSRDLIGATWCKCHISMSGRRNNKLPGEDHG